MVNGDLFNVIGVQGKDFEIKLIVYWIYYYYFSRHLVMSKDKRQADVSPPKPTREKIKYQVEKTEFTRKPPEVLKSFSA